MFDDLGYDDDTLIGFVVPWSGEVLAPPVEAPPELPGGTPQSPEFPELSPPIPYIIHGAVAVWNDVWDWTKNEASTVWGWITGSSGVSVDQVKQLILQGLSTAQTAWSSFDSQLENYVNHGFQFLEVLSTELSFYIDNVATTLEAYTTQVYFELANDLLRAIQGVDNVITLAQAEVENKIIQAEQDVQSWVISDVYIPLQQYIVQSIDSTNTILAEAVSQVDDRLTQLEKVAVPGLLGAIALLENELGPIKTEVDECLTPMCETQGPNTNLGKLLANPELLALLALLLGLTLGDPRALVEASAKLAETLGGTLESTVEGWLAPVETLTF